MRKRRIYLATFLLIGWGFFSVDWTSPLIHRGGAATAKQLFRALIHPQLSAETLNLSIQSAGITISYAIAGISISLLIAFFLGICASGILSKKENASALSARMMRHALTFMRSIHELVWAWLFVATFGLSPLSAIFALGIPYGGTLGRIFADMLLDVPKPPIKSLSASGAGKLQKLFYGYLPYALPNMVSYAFYRFECALRASTVMSFVGLGGLGYQIQLSLNDLEYNEAFTYLYALILLIFLIEVWSSQLRHAMISGRQQNRYLVRLSTLAVLISIAVSWAFIHTKEGISFTDIFNEKNGVYTLKFIRGLLGYGQALPAFLDSTKWAEALRLSFQTLQMSIFALVLAAFFALLLAFPAARKNTQATRGHALMHGFVFYPIRLLLIVTRAIPELVWAMLFVFLFTPGPLPGILALAVHNFGILGKLCAEVVENMEKSPLDSLKASGAGSIVTLFYGVLPLTIPKFITFILYRWEVIIRTTIIVGFVGAGGLGQAFKLSMSWFHYSDITLYLICYLMLIGAVDKLANYLRRAVD